MKTKTIPFDLETAKKIQAGEIEGKIKTRDSKDVDEIVFFRTPLEYSIYAVINGICHSFIKEGYERPWDKSGSWKGDLVLEVHDNEHQFNPFDQVLVRDPEREHTHWTPAIFQERDSSPAPYMASGLWWKECIPYKGNEHLVGTTNNPKEE